jgi:hypothetical protein
VRHYFTRKSSDPAGTGEIPKADHLRLQPALLSIETRLPVWTWSTSPIHEPSDANSFDNGRQVSAWLGLVPRQCSSGGKPTLLGMSKRGDAYLRTLLIHGARSAILAAQRKSKNTNLWLTNLLNRRHPNIAAVALANKNVRTVWAMLAHDREFKANYAIAIAV